MNLKLMLLCLGSVLLSCTNIDADDDQNKIDANDRPNILWLSTEDMGPHLACYGDATAKTPTLDAFAKRALVFDRAWSNYPVCAPARTTIITGMYAASNGAGNQRSNFELAKSIQMFPKLMRDAGYFCTNNSKEDYNHPKTGKVWDISSRKAHWRERKEGQPFFAVFNHTGTHESQLRKTASRRRYRSGNGEACLVLARYTRSPTGLGSIL